ncbi:MBL fold metallo-hydrolase [Caldivirga maquilingensis]|uniref:Beta-lactamase domain protein n=1 Tax=Caldivirga maquilingensis (strain ATCC 700844 / DSM 13496 / JCM 10307 / IC-167) TaxID=397948 RepID=A8M900_CALMQ|nr:MBL fold metallo-hydrolase [Caldivirga maquilingensis]ABW02219.1 beta-lactamase domain protein [Caldivirga maquilingensis IC-167]
MHKWEVLSPGVPLYTNMGFVGYCTSLLVEADGYHVVIDPGHYGNREYMLKALSSRGIKPSDVEHIILTHVHYDHALNITLFPNAKIYISKNEYEYSMSSNDPYEVPFLLQLMRNRLVFIKEDDELYGIKFVELPGHTAGSIGVVINNDTLVAGDAIKYITEAIKKSTTFAYYDINKANASIVKAINMAHIIIPGHDAPFMIKGNETIEPLSNKSNNFIIYLRSKVNLSISIDF